ncbi:hypothetical protein ACHAXR_011590 [Thalassiosira sp. AJA248-18]
MFAASAASSSRALLVSCRRRCWPSLHNHRLAARGAEPNPIKSFGGGNNINLLNSSSSSSHFAFSTISFDGNAIDPNTTSTSYESVADSQPSASLNHQSPTQNQPIDGRQISRDSEPNHQQFQQQIQQWISTNPKIAPYKAEEALAKLWVEQQELFHQWEEEERQRQQHSSATDESSVSSQPQPTILLTTDSVNVVLQAWCYCNKGEIGAKRAERLLHWMEDLHYSSDSSESFDSEKWSSFLPKPNYSSYATVIDAWSRAAAYESLHPKPASTETVTKSGGKATPATKAGFECAKNAEEMLMHMQRMHEQQLQMAEESEQSVPYNSEIQPDTRVFNLVLKAWSKGTKASAIRAMRILDLMQELHHYQSMNAPEWQGIVMSKVQPNLQTYKLVLHAWAHATHTIEGPDRAEEILRHMLSLSKAGNMGVEIMPDAECFHIVMKAHAESIRKRRKGGDGSASVERAQKVAALLDWMELLALRGATSKIQPTTESYRIALSAWVWSHHVDAPKEAEGILFQMIRACDANANRLYRATPGAAGNNASVAVIIQPETRDFNTLINCCSFARKVGADRSDEDEDSLLERQIAHQEVFKIAKGALDTLISSSYAQPDSATFSGIIRACLNLLPNTDERDDLVIELFRLAYHTPPSEAHSGKISSTSSERMRAPPGAGCVDANVLRQLRHALPSTEDYIRVREEFEKFRRRNAGEE